MRILVAPDSFKGSLSASAAAEAMARGVRAACPGVETVCLPLADGGEGTVDSIRATLGGREIRVQVTGPLGDPVVATYLLAGDTAYLEMASASGLPLTGGRRDPLRACTYGTGQLLAHAARTARRVVIGAGGSATVDGGIGALSALGIRFEDEARRPLVPGGGSLPCLASVDASGVDAEVMEARLVVAADVENPMVGPDGAARVFGPQKGATPDQVSVLEQGLSHLCRLTSAVTGKDMSSVPHGGAAGGLAGALWAYLGATLEPGARLILDLIGFDRRLDRADLVLTGEGRLDRTTWAGKAVSEVVRRASAREVPVVALAGSIRDESLHAQKGLSAWGSIVPGPAAGAESTRRAEEWLEAAAARHLRWFEAGRVHGLGGEQTRHDQ